ncbi:hypothetical protein [Ferribacterium limneticum]|uniref:hypothetical protein n=1 Tax=Ferribacterium limneticum TaxID=76259 RepID=UPI001CFC125E|nr:hypothetical protein [Ferribacterium limneticum]UCV29824.1 hypothetical protein KI617_06995 [Ferribacterium limneticum]UCV33743.1 hypothetical protein KI608_06995 [Ferribacterium limneticum]
MRRFLKWLVITLLLPLSVAAALILFATDPQALVDRGEVISPASVAQAKHLLAANDPRRQQAGEIRTLAIPAALIDEGINYAASRYLHARGALALIDDTGEVRITFTLPGKRFLNLRALAHTVDGKLRIVDARLGAIAVPPALVEFVFTKAVAALGFDREWLMAENAIQHISFNQSQATVSITYIWEPGILDRARAVALSPDDIARLREARGSLAALVAHRAPGSRIILSDVLKAMLPASGDPLKQGRATLLVLSSHLADKDLAALVPAARNWPRVRWVNITLAGRHDLAQHFVISAAFAAWTGEPVADAIGLYKELEDARRGSGFSFIDLAADRAGTRFGETLLRNPEALQKKIKGGLSDEQLLPAVGDLPEYLHEPEFKRRFASHESPQFKAMTHEIERRLDTLPLYR